MTKRGYWGFKGLKSLYKNKSLREWQNDCAFFHLKFFTNILHKMLVKNLLSTRETHLCKDVFTCELYGISPRFCGSGLSRLSSKTSNFFPVFLRQKYQEDVNYISKYCKVGLLDMKNLLVWEQFFCPGFVVLNNFCDWYIMMVNKDVFFWKHRWISKNISFLICYLVLAKNIQFQVDFFLPTIVKNKLISFLKKGGFSKNSIVVSSFLAEKGLKWSDLLNQKLFNQQTPFYEHEQGLFFKGGWLEGSVEALFVELKNWNEVGSDEEIDPYVLFYDFERELDFEDIGLYVWPFTVSREEAYQHLYDLTPSLDGMFRFSDADLFEFIFFLLKDREVQVKYTVLWSSYIQTTLRETVWDDLLVWIDLIYPRVFNTISLSNWRPFFVVFFLKRITSFVNLLFLFGLRGSDRRNIFFRFFFFFVCKARGFFFKWFCVSLKNINLSLPWPEELNVIVHVLEQDQIFFLERCKVSIETSLSERYAFLKKNYPVFFFVEFFFKNYFSKMVLQKREELYPNFIETLKRYLLKDSSLVGLYCVVVTIHVYTAVFFELIKSKELLIRYFILYEKTLPEEERILSKDDLNNNICSLRRKMYLKERENSLSLLLYRKIFVSLTRSKRNFSMSFIFSKSVDFEKINNYKAVVTFLYYLKSHFLMFCRSFWKMKTLHFITYYSLFVNGCLNEFLIKQEFFHTNKYSTMENKFFTARLKKQYKLYNQKVKSRLAFWYLLKDLFENILYKFTIRKITIFLKDLCVYFLLRIALIFFSLLYTTCWAVIYRFRKWRWSVLRIFSEKKGFMSLWGWKTSQKNLTTEEAHKDFFVYTAYIRSISKAQELEHLSGLFQIFNKKLRMQTDPFSHEIWTDILLLAFLFVSYRKLHKNVNWYRREFYLLINKITFSNLFDNIFFFKFWSFLFSFLFFSFYRVLFLCWLCLGVYFGVLFLNLFWCLVRAFVFLGVWFGRILFLSFVYPFFMLLIYVVYSIFFSIKTTGLLCQILYWFFFEALRWFVKAFNQHRRFFGIVFVFVDLFFLILDGFLFVIYKILRIWLVWSCVMVWIKDIILYFGRFLVLGVILLSKYIICFLNSTAKNRRSFFMELLVQEKTQFYNDFREIVFVFSFVWKAICFVVSFFFFLVCGLGWSLFFFTYSDGTEISQIEPSSKQAYSFLDKWAFYFLNLLFFLNLDLMRNIQWMFYRFSEFLIVLFSYGLYYIIFMGVFVKFFFIELFSEYWKRLGRMVGWNKFWNLCVFFGFCVKNVLTRFSFKKSAKVSVLNSSVGYKNNSLFKLLFLRTITFFYTNSSLFKFLKKISKKKNWLFWLEKYMSIFLKKNQVRDLQEMAVFVKFFYNFSIFYWAWVMQISMEFGDLGWWLNYSKYRKTSLDSNKKRKDWLVKSSSLSSSSWNRNEITSRNSVLHFYYLTLNFFLQNITRYKPYIINSFYLNKPVNNFKKSWFFKRKVFAIQFIRRIGHWLGFSFLFEIMLQRFHHPINSLIFGRWSENLHWPSIVRLKYFKDFFTEFTWLIRYTYTNVSLSVDTFIGRFVNVFVEHYRSRLFYYAEFRDLWFFSILRKPSQFLFLYFPKFRWNFFKLLSTCVVFMFFSFLYVILFLVFFVICFLWSQFLFLVGVRVILQMILRWIYNLFFL